VKASVEPLLESGYSADEISAAFLVRASSHPAGSSKETWWANRIWSLVGVMDQKRKVPLLGGPSCPHPDDLCG